MMLHELKAGKVARNRPRKRIGRGESSGWGKTAGRGAKGSGQRAGRKHQFRHEGGRLPFFRRIPKRGFSNALFKTTYQVVNLGQLEKLFDAGAVVDGDSLADKGLVTKADALIKILADGKLTKSLTVKANKLSSAAAEAIQAAGGTVEALQ